VLWQKPGAGTKINLQSAIEVGISAGPVVKRVIKKPVRSKYDNLDPESSEQSGKLLPNKQPTFSNPEETFVVCVDPGHQRKANLSLEPIGPGSLVKKPGVSGGATGISSRTPEYEITLKIGLMLKQLLEAKQIKVVMTRTSNDIDINNIKRAEIANSAGADLFIRIHADGSTDKSVNGISTLYPAENSWTKPFYQKSLKAARIVQSSLVKSTGRKDNGIKARSDITGFNWSKVPVVLVETGFLSSPNEDRLLNTADEQQKIANGLAAGIAGFLSSN
jgi:N-acetylmuramoyl-L-alanine amidase